MDLGEKQLIPYTVFLHHLSYITAFFSIFILINKYSGLSPLFCPKKTERYI